MISDVLHTKVGDIMAHKKITFGWSFKIASNDASRAINGLTKAFSRIEKEFEIDKNKFYSIHESAELLNCNRTTINNIKKAGFLLFKKQMTDRIQAKSVLNFFLGLTKTSDKRKHKLRTYKLKNLLTISEAAAFLNCSETTVRRLVNERVLTAYKRPIYMISGQALIGFIAEHTSEGKH